MVTVPCLGVMYGVCAFQGNGLVWRDEAVGEGEGVEC